MRTASHTILTGAYLALGAFFCFSLQDASVKWLVAGDSGRASALRTKRGYHAVPDRAIWSRSLGETLGFPLSLAVAAQGYSAARGMDLLLYRITPSPTVRDDDDLLRLAHARNILCDRFSGRKGSQDPLGRCGGGLHWRYHCVFATRCLADHGDRACIACRRIMVDLGLR